jgi:hypothetical protein
MRKLFTTSLFITLLAAAVIGQSKFTTYDNDRFYFSIEYPSDVLKMQAPPANNDGRTFRSKDKTVEMRVWGQYNALDRNLNEEYNEALAGYGSGVTYKVLGESSFVISGTAGGKIYYQKTMLRTGGAEVFFTFTIEYPKAQKSRFDRAVARIARSFKFDPDAQP